MGTVQKFGERPPTKRQFPVMAAGRIKQSGDDREVIIHPRRFAISREGTGYVDLKEFYEGFAAACRTGATTTKQRILDEILDRWRELSS